MPNPNSINPKTGKRYNFVDPRQAERDLHAIEKDIALLERQKMALEARADLLTFTRFTMPDPADPNNVHKSRYEDEEFHRIVARHLTQFIHGDLGTKQLIFAMPPRHGKACAHDTPILTPTGWRQHGDLKPGDFVFGPDGRPTEVIAVSADVDEVVPVALSNGDIIRCHLNHEWKVHDRSSGRSRIMETRDIAKRTLRVGPEGRGGRYVLQLPDIEPLAFPTAILPLHPYVLGAWLGDGSEGSTRIAHAQTDLEVVDAIEACGHVANRRWSQLGTGVAYATFSGDKPGVGSEMQRALVRLGVLRNKHIPDIYLRASVDQRMQLLAGLVDTDGHVERPTGRVRFSTCSEALRDGVYDLALTLGFRPYVAAVQPAVSSSGIVGRKITYQIGFQPTRRLPTRIPRKQITKFAVRRRVGVVSVGAVEKAGARSICVAREDGLYLVGRQLNVTKNTALGTKSLAAWVSGKHPEWDIAVASYSDTMAEDMGADIRAIMNTPQFKQVFPTYRLRRGGSAKNNIQTEKGGRLVAVGRGGALTGRGMMLGIGDDLFKDHEEARSQAVRDAAWNWFTKVFMTRRMGPKLVLLSMTRWHSDDVIGRLTDPENPHYNEIEARKWKIILLPAIAEDDDPLGRKPGEALWPGRYDLDFLQSQQRLDPLGFSALYQQRPTVADGVMFRRETVQYYAPEQLPDELRIYCSSDHAVAEKQRNDPSCLLKVGVDKQNNIYLLDCIWRRMAADAAVEAMLAMAGGNMRPLLWWAERGHISKSIGPFLRKRMEETGTYINMVEVTPVADKATRAQSIAARVGMGKVYFPKVSWWTEKAVNELMAFPNGTHDDFCLAADTPVTMSDGGRLRIADIRVGDLVRAPNGPRRVTAAGKTASSAELFRVTLSDGRFVEATVKHPFFVHGKGFVPVDALAYKDVVYCDQQDQHWPTSRLSSIEETAIDGTQIAHTATTEPISMRQSHGVGFCTAIFGKTTRGLFQKATKFITGMRTHLTTISEICAASKSRGTEHSMCPSGQKATTTTSGLQRFDRSRKLGMRAKKEDCGTVSTGKNPGKGERQLLSFACAAAKKLRRISRNGGNSAGKAAVFVTSVEALTTRQPVYNLTVENEHVFFANGVLTHNCDALAYIGLGLQSQFGPAKMDAKPGPATGTLNWLKQNDKWAEARRRAFAGGFG